MARDYLSRARSGKTFLLKPRPTNLQQRERWLPRLMSGERLWALALLPVIGFLLVAPRFAHARIVGAVFLGLFAVCEFLGVPRLARCLYGEFDLLGAVAFGALVLLLVILMYTGIFVVSFFFTG